jgi:hypothetical protein
MSRKKLGSTLHFLCKIFPSGEKEAAAFYRNLQNFAGSIAVIVSKKIQWTNGPDVDARIPKVV